jgi:hypothetical protein
MNIQIILQRTIACVFIAGGALALTPAAARADVSVEGGAAITGSTASGAGALSLGLLNAPVVPLSVELTGLVPGNGGYAATVDARFSFAGTAIGAGAGVGSVGSIFHTGAVYDALLAHGIAPHTALEARLYFGPTRPSTLFAGVRFSL